MEKIRIRLFGHSQSGKTQFLYTLSQLDSIETQNPYTQNYVNELKEDYSANGRVHPTGSRTDELIFEGHSDTFNHDYELIIFDELGEELSNLSDTEMVDVPENHFNGDNLCLLFVDGSGQDVSELVSLQNHLETEKRRVLTYVRTLVRSSNASVSVMLVMTHLDLIHDANARHLCHRFNEDIYQELNKIYSENDAISSELVDQVVDKQLCISHIDARSTEQVSGVLDSLIRIHQRRKIYDKRATRRIRSTAIIGSIIVLIILGIFIGSLFLTQDEDQADDLTKSGISVNQLIEELPLNHTLPNHDQAKTINTTLTELIDDLRRAENSENNEAAEIHKEHLERLCSHIERMIKKNAKSTNLNSILLIIFRNIIIDDHESMQPLKATLDVYWKDVARDTCFIAAYSALERHRLSDKNDKGDPNKVLEKLINAYEQEYKRISVQGALTQYDPHSRGHTLDMIQTELGALKKIKDPGLSLNVFIVRFKPQYWLPDERSVNKNNSKTPQLRTATLKIHESPSDSKEWTVDSPEAYKKYIQDLVADYKATISLKPDNNPAIIINYSITYDQDQDTKRPYIPDNIDGQENAKHYFDNRFEIKNANRKPSEGTIHLDIFGYSYLNSDNKPYERDNPRKHEGYYTYEKVVVRVNENNEETKLAYDFMCELMNYERERLKEEE